MNKTYNMNLGGLPFQIDEDAFERLNAYLSAVKRKFSHMQGSDEIVEDIEARIAEMFMENMHSSSRKIVSMKDVEAAVEAMGKPEEFDQDFDEEETSRSNTSGGYATGKKLYRDPDDKVFGGVISGITKYFGYDNPRWARIILVVLPFLDFFGTLGVSTGFLILSYIVLWVAVPKAETPTEKMQMRGERINLDNIERNVSDGLSTVKKNLNNTSPRRNSSGLGEVLGTIVVGIGKLLLFFGLFIAGIITISLLIAFFAGIFGLGATTPFLNQYIFGNPWQSWVFLIGSFLMLLAVPIFIISLLVKLLFKTKTNMPAIAFGTLGAFILGMIMTSFSGVSLIKDFSSQSTIKETKTLENLPEISLFGNETESTWRDGGIGFDKSFITQNVDLYILPSRDSVATLEIKKSAKGLNQEAADNRVKTLGYNYQINANKLIFDNELSLGEEVFRDQEVDIDLRIPENTVLVFDESAHGVVKYANFNNQRIYDTKLTDQGRWKYAEGEFFAIDKDGERLKLEESTDDGEYRYEGKGNIDIDGDNEHVRIKLFGKEILEVDVNESSDGSGTVDVKIGEREAVRIEVDEDGEVIGVED